MNYTFVNLSDLKECMETTSTRENLTKTPPARTILINKQSTLSSGNLNYKAKIKIIDNPISSKLLKPIANSTPDRMVKKGKSNSVSSINFNQYNTKSIYNSQFTKLQSNISANTPYRFINTNKLNDQLPYIEGSASQSKNQKNVISSSSNKLTNSSSSNSIAKNTNKFNTINSSQGISISALHKRAGSTNYFNK
jgi:hypothetical protein